MILDMKTVMLLYAVINAICAVFIAIMWYFNHRRFAGISFWLTDMVLQAVGSMLIVLRGIVPDFISMTVSNTMIIAGILILYIGLERFLGKKSSHIHNYILIAIFVAILSYFTYVQPSLTVRTFNISVITLVLTFQCAWLMLRRIPQDIRRSTSIVGLVFTGYVFISIARIILLAVFPIHSSDFFKTGTPDTIIIILYIMLAAGLVFGLVLMVNSRLLMDIRSLAKFPEENPNFIGRVDYDGKLLFYNPAYIKIFKDNDYIHIKLQDAIKKIAAEKITVQEDVEIEIDNRVFLFNLILIKEESYINFYGIDITNQKKTEEELKESRMRLDIALEARQIGIWELDLIKGTSVRNLRHDQIFGYKEKIAKWGVKIFFEHIIPKDRPSAQAVFNKAMKTDKLHFECRILWPDKSIHWITETGKVIRDRAGKPQKMLGTVIDITERKGVEEEISYLSYRDQLTDLHNRRFLEEELKRLDTQRQLPISIVMADVNGLKYVNDTYGHEKGDRILIATSKIIKNSCRKEDIIARWGGDEFIILLPKTPEKDALDLIDRVRKTCNVQKLDDKLNISVSLGLSTKHELGEKIEDTIKQADKNMYVDKTRQKNNVKE